LPLSDTFRKGCRFFRAGLSDRPLRGASSRMCEKNGVL
jgi:hypothetical protein